MADERPSDEHGLWRGVIRPLAESERGPIVCDARDPTIPERLLAVTGAEIHAVAPGEAVASLAPAYAGRLLLHDSARDAWPAARGCRLAVLDARCQVAAHLDALASVGVEPPAILLHGLNSGRGAGGAGDPLAMLGRRGFELIELDGFPHARLVVPAGSAAGHPLVAFAGSVAAPRRGQASNGRSNGSTAPAEPPVAPTVQAEEPALRAQLEQAEARVTAAEAARHAAERRVGTSQDMIDALRVFNDEARADLGRMQAQVNDLRRLVREAERFAERARAASAELGLERDGLREERARLLRDVEAQRALARATRTDLGRLHASHAWRLGHALTRVARVLTFRRPGRTDALSKAIARLDAAPPAGPDQPA